MILLDIVTQAEPTARAIGKKFRERIINEKKIINKKSIKILNFSSRGPKELFCSVKF